MGKSFVLKNASGHPRGYLMQTGESVRCRIEAASEAEVTLLFENGTSVTHGVNAHAPEQSWMHGGSRLTGGYVLEAGSLTLATDEQARHGAALRLRAAVQHKDRSADTAVPQASQPEKQAAEKQSVQSLPQRRWPPPPCMPMAAYRDGQWRQMD